MNCRYTCVSLFIPYMNMYHLPMCQIEQRQQYMHRTYIVYICVNCQTSFKNVAKRQTQKYFYSIETTAQSCCCVWIERVKRIFLESCLCFQPTQILQAYRRMTQLPHLQIKQVNIVWIKCDDYMKFAKNMFEIRNHRTK